MKNKVLYLLIIVAISLSSCGGGPGEDVLISDTKEFISKTSNETIELLEIEVDSKKYETVVNDEILNYSFTGTITFKKDCYLDWNDGNKPVFVPVYEKPTHSDSAKFMFHEIGDTVKYKGYTTYIKKKDGWELLAM